MNRAKRTEVKRLKRKRIVAGKKRLVPEKFNVKGLPWYKLASFMSNNKSKGTGKKKAPKIVKPYRIVRVQHQIDKLEAGVRALDHKDPNRARLLKRLEEKRKLIGNQTYELSKKEKDEQKHKN